MNLLDRINQIKITLTVVAIVIAAASLVVNHLLVNDLAEEERKRMEIWAEAMHSLSNANPDTDLSLVLKVMEGNTTIPVVVTYSDGTVLSHRNIRINATTEADSLAQIAERVRQMRLHRRPIEVSMGQGEQLLVCYDDSSLLRRLAYYPYIQLGVVLVFVLIALFALLASKRAEQNKVWVGLSKETAHQLGTPISSLMAWTEILRETYPDDPLIPEMDKDVKRLQLIADRFSKIGSAPERAEVLLGDVLASVVDYMNRRTSKKVLISYELSDADCHVLVNRQLFEWVFENLCKNAVDAMEGRGTITIHATVSQGRTIIDVTDTGKGIDRSHIKTVFRPGFTTKKRGWGLGLSLARRIIEEYHHGRIYVLRSEVGVGTTFRIEL